MDNFKRRAPGTPQRQAMDGFFSKPAGGTYTGRPQSRAQARPAPQQRRVDNFARADGFYAPTRRSVATAEAPRRQPISRSGLNMDLPESGKAHKAKAKKQGGKFQVIRKWAFRSVAFSLIAVLLVSGFLFAKGYFKLQKVFQGGSKAAALAANVDPSLLKGEGDGRVNILLMGIGGAQHDGGDLTDTMMIASVDPVNNGASLVSIPRDIWTKMPNNYISNYQKINAAYESGKYKFLGKEDQKSTDHKAVMAGFAGVDETVERVTGVPIHYNVVVNFQAFAQAVDTLGGITINAPEKLYDPTMAWENKWNPTLAVAGINNFNGHQALNYVRSRETTSDFARGQRQRIMLMALKDKAMNLGTLTNPLKLSSLLSAFGDNVESDISLSDMTRMATIMKNIPSSAIQSVGLTDGTDNLITTGNINGMSVVMPKAGLEDYSQIQAYIRSKLKDGFIAKENANITILNGSGTAGLATEKANELKTYGYNIGTVSNAPTEDYTQTKIIDLSGGAKKYTLNYLKNRFNVTTIDHQLPANIVPGSANIVIILGTDATSNTTTE